MEAVTSLSTSGLARADLLVTLLPWVGALEQKQLFEGRSCRWMVSRPVVAAGCVAMETAATAFQHRSWR